MLIGVLAGLNAVLLGLGRLEESPSREEGMSAVTQRAAQQGAAAAIDTLLKRYGIEPEDVHTWIVQWHGKSGSRVEQRVSVPPSFVALSFNHDLNLALMPMGAHVVATERTKENLVTMHIVSHGSTIRSIAFAVVPERKGEGFR